MKKNFSYIVVGVLIGLILPDKEKTDLKKDQTRLVTACVSRNQEIQVLIGALQSERTTLQLYSSETPVPRAVEIKNFIGALFWVKDISPDGDIEYLTGSEVHIVEHKMPQHFDVPPDAAGYVLKGTLFEE